MPFSLFGVIGQNNQQGDTCTGSRCLLPFTLMICYYEVRSLFAPRCWYHADGWAVGMLPARPRAG